MSTTPPTYKQRSDSERRNHFDSTSPLEQLLGMLVVILVLLLAIVLRSL